MIQCVGEVCRMLIFDKHVHQCDVWEGRWRMASNCETCMNYEYDEEYEYYVCTKNLDEDEMYRFLKGDFKECPYYQFGDEYQIVRKQM